MQNHTHADDRGLVLGHAAALSRRGAPREENQDSVLVDDHVWVLADGMGGHEGGRTASAVAVASAALAVQPGDEDLTGAVEAGHDQVCIVGDVIDQPTMGSTLVLAVRDPESGVVRIAWCGDSRAYVLVDGSLTRLTRDHNLAEEEVRAGRISAAEAFDHPGQSILVNALGCGSADVPEVGQVQIEGRGRLLLCSDGLTSGLRDEQIADLLDGDDGLDGVTRRLVDAAVAAGSSDDTTVIVVDLERAVEPELVSEADEQRDEQIEAAVLALGARPVAQKDRLLHFHLDDLAGYAYDKGGQLLRMSIFLDDEVPFDEALDWVEAQPGSRVGSLEVSYGDADRPLGQPRLLVERLLPLQEEDALAIAQEVRLYSAAWDARRTVTADELPARHASDLLSRAPRNAWLLYGGADSLEEAEECAWHGDDWRGVSSLTWTVPKHVEPGDLVLIYFRSPFKEVRYAARVAGHPFYDDSEPTSARSFARQQWWAWLTPLVEVGPVALAELTALAGERVVARAHGGTYIRPELAAALVEHLTADEPADSMLRRVCQPVGERPGLPDPQCMTFEEWRDLPLGPLRLEADVERYVVEPLLRWVSRLVPGAAVARQKPVGRGVADYALEVEDEAVLVVEAKQRVPRGAGAAWADVPAARQLRRYMDGAGCPVGLLVDAHEVHLFDAMDDSPVLTFSRVEMTSSDLRTLAHHVRRFLPVTGAAPQPARGYEDMLHSLAASGFVCPPLGEVEPADIAGGSWHWSSREVMPRDLYLHNIDVVAALLAEGHLFALCYVGHGFNSYGPSVVTGKGPVAVFVQRAYGGMYMNNEDQKAAINATYGRLHALLAEVEDEGAPRWLLSFSDFRRGAELIDLDRLGVDGQKAATVAYDREEALFEAVRERLVGSPSGTGKDDGDADE